MAKDKKHFIEPIRFGNSRKASHKCLLKVLKSLPRTKITVNGSDYIRAECTSLLFRFIDDIEFVFDERKKSSMSGLRPGPAIRILASTGNGSNPSEKNFNFFIRING